MGFVKAQREQIQVSEVTDGAFIPAAAKSNALIAGTAGGASTGEGARGGAAAADDGVPIAGVSQISHFNAELGFDKAQREQIHVPGLLEGAFIPAAAKSNALIGGTAGGASAGEGAGGGAAAAVDDDDVLVAGMSQISHFNAELGFDKAQREQIHVPGLLEGAFIPAAAKSNPLITGAIYGFITVASRTGGVEGLFTPKMPDDCGLLLLPTILGGLLLLGPKVNGFFCFGLAGSNPKENGVADLEGPDESSKFGSDETGRSLTRLCILATTTELGKTEVALDVMTKLGRELGVIVRAFALMSSTLVSLTFTFFACSCGFGDPTGETSVDLNEKLKLEDGVSNLKSDFGRLGGEGTAGLSAGVDGTEVASGWKLNLNLLGSLGTELNLLRDAVGLTFVGLVEVPEGDDPFSMIGMISFGCSFVFSLCSAASMSMSSNMSIVISGSEATIWGFSAAVGVGLSPLIESLVRFADRRASSASSSSTSSTTYGILLVSTAGASHCGRGLSQELSSSVIGVSVGFSKCAGGRDRWLPYGQLEHDFHRYFAYRCAPWAQ